MRARIRRGDRTAVAELVAREHPVADLLCRAASGERAGDDVLTRAWTMLIGDIRSGEPAGSLRAALLGHVVRVLDDQDAFDPAETPPAPGWGPFLPEGDRWAGWWAEDPDPWPDGTVLSPEQILRALRGLPLGPRVLLVLRDAARLAPEQAEPIVGAPPERQAVLLEEAREAYVARLDRAL